MPAAADVVVTGGGVHGLSTAAHLASQRSVVVVEKGRIGSGASGISGGIVRNFYLSEAMNEIVRQSVNIFELDPQLFGFRQVGYLAVVPERQAGELQEIARQHAAIGYPSKLIEGARATRSFMRAQFSDWSASGTAAVLQEERGGWADARRTLDALAGIARAEGAVILEGIEVVGFEFESGAVVSVETSGGSIRCEIVVVAPGPWARDFWRMLELDETVPCEGGSEPVFHYWGVREGEFLHADAAFDPNAPVVHLDVDQPLVSPEDGATVLHAPWGIYFRPSLAGAIACGGLPVPMPSDVALDPYGPSHQEVGRGDPSFDRSSALALAWALARFRDRPNAWRVTSFVAPTCFTPDSYPIVGFARDNAYVIVDSNHGFKLLALGQLAAAEIVDGSPRPELDPFRAGRFSVSAVHPSSASPYPWT